MPNLNTVKKLIFPHFDYVSVSGAVHNFAIYLKL